MNGPAVYCGGCGCLWDIHRKEEGDEYPGFDILACDMCPCRMKIKKTE